MLRSGWMLAKASVLQLGALSVLMSGQLSGIVSVQMLESQLAFWLEPVLVTS